MKRITIDFVVGVFVLLGMLCLTFLALKVATASFNTSNNNNYTIYASFNNIGSLKIGAPVKVAGFIVGRVTNIGLDQKTYQALVTIQIHDQYKFSTDTSAQILTIGLLGEQYVELQSGADNSFLKNGSTITLTSSAFVLENLIGKLITNISK